MVEGLTVALHSRHVFASGSASDDVLELKGRIPDDVDVILGSDLVFIIAGTVKSGRVASGVVRRSAVAKHIIDYFRTNAHQLGLNMVSDIYIDEIDGSAKFSVTSARPLRAQSRLATVRLLSVDLKLSCKFTSRFGNASTEEHPFAGQVYLPVLSCLDRVVEKFVCYHLVKRYPLIFGPWRAVSSLSDNICR